jgi:simple sugar transport system permease protein
MTDYEENMIPAAEGSSAAALRPAPPKTVQSRLRWLQGQGLVVLPIIVVVFIVGAIISPVFLTVTNLVSNVLYQTAVLAVLALAETLMLLSNRFDLSIESVVGIAPAVAAWLIVAPELGGKGVYLDVAVGILLIFAIGAAVGLINGLLVVKLGLNTFMITLAMLILLRGLTLGVTGGAMIFNMPRSLTYIGRASVGPVPISVLIAVVLYVAAALFLRYHRLGKAIYAIGGNEEAARAGGVRVERLRLGLYVLSGTLAALAGLMLTGRQATVLPNQGQGMVFSVFAAAVIGGVSLNGGRGKMLGAFLGVVLIGTVQNILTLSHLSSFWIDAVFGAIIVGAVLLSKVTVRE